MESARWPLVPGLLLLVSLCAVTLSGCSEPPPVAGTEGDPTSVAVLLSQANAEMETIIGTISNTPPTSPAGINFSAPLAKYEQVLEQEPANATANFGAGLLGLLSLTYDSEVNAAFTEWKDYLTDRVPFESGPAALSPLGIPTALTAGRGAYRLPYAIVPLTTVALARSTRVAADPQISRVQNILRDRVLPRLTIAIARLGVVAAQPGFVFTVTHELQGDPDALPIEIDNTDLLASKAAAELLAAACHAAVAYDLGFATYDGPGLVSALSPGGSWLKLRTDGAAQMSNSRVMLVAALADVEASLASFQAETDNQNDDFIVGISPADREEILLNVGKVRDGITNGITLTEDWDQNPSTAKTPLTIRLDRLFSDPIADWKAVLPPYVVTTTTGSLSGQWEADWQPRQLTVVIDSDSAGAGYYSGYCWIEVSGGQVSGSGFGGSEVLRAPFAATVQQEYLRIQALPGYGGECYIYVNLYGSYLHTGSNQVTVDWYSQYYLSGHFVSVPVITWNADSYDGWTWNITAMNGLFPDITTSPELLSTFGYHRTWWRKTLVFDWAEGSDGWSPRSTPRPPLPAVARRR